MIRTVSPWEKLQADSGHFRCFMGWRTGKWACSTGHPEGVCQLFKHPTALGKALPHFPVYKLHPRAILVDYSMSQLYHNFGVCRTGGTPRQLHDVHTIAGNYYFFFKWVPLSDCTAEGMGASANHWLNPATVVRPSAFWQAKTFPKPDVISIPARI